MMHIHGVYRFVHELLEAELDLASEHIRSFWVDDYPYDRDRIALTQLWNQTLISQHTTLAQHLPWGCSL